tara:strand:- start:415 stop:624 length:210 start_codon:yes stop_codon:yes gene_type:complete
MTDSFKYGITAQGRNELKKHLEGKKITYKQAVLGKCYECNLGYCDGKVSCEIPDCPLFQYMPYKKTGWD